MSKIENTRSVANSEIRTMYDQNIGSKYQGSYEFKRWFEDARVRLDYAMTYKSISHHIQEIDFETCLELGPGPGTWTRILYRRNPKAVFDLVDISAAMKEQFMLEMRELSNVNYYVSDFFEFDSNKDGYDLFFSSRAVEYIDDLEKLMIMIAGFMSDSSTGIIITKNPRHFRLKKFLGLGANRKHHTGQISVEKMELLLKANGFSNISFYPCIIRLPILDRFVPALSERMHARVYKIANRKMTRFAESYVVKFSK